MILIGDPSAKAPGAEVPGAPHKDLAMIDLSELTGDPAVREAIEAAHAAQIALVNDPTIAQGDPVAFTLIFGLYAFAKAGGECSMLRDILDRVGLMQPVGRG